MVRIRLRRMGSKKQPIYRIVIADKEAPRDGAFIETVGIYNPRTEPATIQVKEERILYWMNVGASPSESTAMLLKKVGTLGRVERLRKGEALEALVAEAAANLAPVPDQRTRIGRVTPQKPKTEAAAAAAE